MAPFGGWLVQIIVTVTKIVNTPCISTDKLRQPSVKSTQLARNIIPPKLPDLIMTSHMDKDLFYFSREKGKKDVQV